MFVLDSSVLIEVFENEKYLQKLTQIMQEQPMITTSICMHEVLAGAITEKDKFVLEGLFSRMRVLEHNSQAALNGALIERKLTKEGTKINSKDILIAGICQANNAEIITLDKDFAKIKNLKSIIIK